MTSRHVLGLLDYLVFGLTLLASAAIGVYYGLTGQKQRTEREYLLGDHSMHALPVAFSLMASFMSAITLMGLTQEMYYFGTQFILINAAYLLGTPLAAFLYFPVFHHVLQDADKASVYYYLELRFGTLVRILASLAFSAQMIMYMGIVIYAPALALAAVTDLTFVGAILVVGAVCTFYSTLGGLKAVLATDVLQSLLMFAALFVVVITGASHLGGLANVFSIAEEGGRIELLRIDIDPTVRHTIWTQMIGGCAIFCSVYCVNQAQVQRLLSTGSLSSGQKAIFMQWPILMLLSMSTGLAGLTLYAFYKDCDPVMQGRIERGDQILPLFVVDTMSHIPGLSGLFVAGIFSGSLSTVSSAINSLAAVTMEDFIKPLVNLSPSTSTHLLKVLAFVYGLICVALSFLAEFLGPGVLQASLVVFGVVGGPLLGLFTLGMSSRRANSKGAAIGFVVSLLIISFMGFGQPKPATKKLELTVDKCYNNVSYSGPSDLSGANEAIREEDETNSEKEDYNYLLRISYAWYALLGFLMVLIVGFVFSLITLDKEQCVEQRLLFGFKRKSDKHDEAKRNEETNTTRL